MQNRRHEHDRLWPRRTYGSLAVVIVGVVALGLVLLL